MGSCYKARVDGSSAWERERERIRQFSITQQRGMQSSWLLFSLQYKLKEHAVGGSKELVSFSSVRLESCECGQSPEPERKL